MRALPILALAVVLVPASAAPTRGPIPPQIQVVLEITSYGELPRDLVALLIPFFSKNLYARPLTIPPEKRTDATAAFEHPSGDFVVTNGRFNCIVVAYYSVTPGRDATGRIARDRAGDFELALLDFLESLPEPRPVPREVTFGSRYCSHAT